MVGAGAAGLAAAKQLREHGHAVRVFEMSNDVGGVWQYEEKVEADLMGKELDKRIHSSMYESLRTNLPREVMAFDSLPFTDEYDARRFPHHSAVHKYLRYVKLLVYEAFSYLSTTAGILTTPHTLFHIS